MREAARRLALAYLPFKSMVDMRWRLILGRLAAALTFYAIFATILGSLGMDIHWRGFH
jgi:hypothetical protein